MRATWTADDSVYPFQVKHWDTGELHEAGIYRLDDRGRKESVRSIAVGRMPREPRR